MRYLLLLSLLVGFQVVHAQKSRYWVYLSDKDIENYNYADHLSEKAIKNRQVRNIALWQYTDIPISAQYVEALHAIGVSNMLPSKWLNAVAVDLTAEQYHSVMQLPFVQQLIPLQTNWKVCNASESWKADGIGEAIRQMEAEVFIKRGLSGKGVAIGVIDAGFFRAPDRLQIAHLFEDERVIAMRDFVSPKRSNTYDKRETSLDGHGAEVLEFIAGKDDAAQKGLATQATFYLARTDHGTREWRGEEDNWIRAMEWLDSLGVRLVNTSLGYALGFDEPAENYKPEQMDGNTSAIARACKVATQEKGMFLVVSAGNEGADPRWRIVSTPADAKEVISVGSISQYDLKMSFSSTGPEFLAYLKPNVSCFAPGGTSFAAPVITGFVACLLQYREAIPNDSLFQIIEQSAHLYPMGNNYVGYGVPNAAKALALVEGKILSSTVKELKEPKEEALLSVDANVEYAVVFHKKNATHVLSQERIPIREGELLLQKRKKEVRTTVVIGVQVYEVFWE